MTDTTGYYEQYVGFYWDSDRNAGPQKITIDFKIGSHNQPYPTPENSDEDAYSELLEKQEMWVANNMQSLIEQELVIDVFDHDVVNSVEALEEHIDDMNFELYYY